MSLRINSEAPNFDAETTEGPMNFHEFIGDGWAILFSHPKDFTPVCTTELGYMAGLQPEFAKRNAKPLSKCCGCSDVTWRSPGTDDMAIFQTSGFLPASTAKTTPEPLSNSAACAEVFV